MALNLGGKPQEWAYEEFSNGRWALKRYGLVVKTAHSIEELQYWATVVYGTEAGEEAGKALGRAIERL